MPMPPGSVTIPLAMDKLTLDNKILLGEVTSILKEGRKVILMTRGNSMLPFIRGDVDSVELVRADQIAEGDIVLGLTDQDVYVLHRIIQIDADGVTLMGDGNLRGTEHCSRENVCGKVTAILRPDGKRILTDTAKAIRRARRWRRLLPVRRIILAIYRRTIL